MKDRVHIENDRGIVQDRLSCPSVPALEVAGLAVLILLELLVFSGAFHKFFTHDSLFYMTNIPRSWEQFKPFLLAPSSEMSYRPLNVGFIALVSPFLGTDPRPYHWIPIIFHLANTLLFFILARRILTGSAAILAASAFWGLHSVAGWITYDITYLSDFLLGFLLLLAILLAVEGSRRKSRWLMGASLAVLVLSLLTKEAAVTFPLAVWISLGLSDLRDSGRSAGRAQIWRSFKRAMPLASLHLIVAAGFAGLYAYWLWTGQTYAQGTHSAYDINPWSNLLGKVKYIYWSLNLPDTLSIPNAERNRALAFLAMGCLLLLWILDIVRRRGRLSAIEWAGIVWFAGLNGPSWLLSHRLAKWYLYLPLLGVALAFGVLAANLQSITPARLRRIAVLLIPALLIAPVFFSSSVQTRSYIAASDSAYQSDVLQSLLSDFREARPVLPPEATLFFLPAFEEGISDLISSPPIDRGQLFELYYPGTRVHALFAHKGHRLPNDLGSRSDVVVLQYLNGRLYDVTCFFESTGKMTLYLLPTAEGKAAPLLRKEPAGGGKLYQQYVQMLFADEGARLPDDYLARRDIWILQYLFGRFNDVTEYRKGRRQANVRHVIQALDGLHFSVDRAEYYPDYERFDTPTGAPVFFPTPERDIFTQIGGSTVVVPLHKIPPDSRLRFDVSWMFDYGDGGWAKATLRAGGKESVLYLEYLRPDPQRKSLHWKEVLFDLQDFENKEAELVLSCYNDRGNNTIADWLNWRDIAIESRAP